MRVCLISSRRLCGEPQLLDCIATAVRAGIDAVQVREKDLGGRELARLTSKVIRTVGEAGGEGRVQVLVNGRVDVAQATGADGVHLPARGLPVDRVRQLHPRPFVIGVSAHTPAELVTAEGGGADYIQYGPAFPTASHPGAQGIGARGLGVAVNATALPVWAVGGINPSTAASLAEVGLAGVAVISAILQAQDVPAVVKTLKQIPTSRSWPE